VGRGAGDSTCVHLSRDTYLDPVDFWGEGQHESGLDTGWQARGGFSDMKDAEPFWQSGHGMARWATHTIEYTDAAMCLVSEWATCLP